MCASLLLCSVVFVLGRDEVQCLLQRLRCDENFDVFHIFVKPSDKFNCEFMIEVRDNNTSTICDKCILDVGLDRSKHVIHMEVTMI